MDPDPIQRIAAAVTPAVMVSACALIALGLDNQAGRMTTRIRDLMRERRSGPAEGARADALLRQARILARRHAFLARALAATYVAMLCFVVTSLIALGQGVAAIPAWVTPVAFAVGVVLLGAVAVLAIATIVLARTAILIELEDPSSVA